MTQLLQAIGRIAATTRQLSPAENAQLRQQIADARYQRPYESEPPLPSIYERHPGVGDRLRDDRRYQEQLSTKPRPKLQFGEFAPGDPVTYQGQTWLVVDADAEMEAPGGFTLRLLSDAGVMASDVRIDEVQLQKAVPFLPRRAQDQGGVILERLRAAIEYEARGRNPDPHVVEENDATAQQMAATIEQSLTDGGVLAYRYVPSQNRGRSRQLRLESVGTHWTLDPKLHETMSRRDLTSLRGKPWQLTAIIPIDSIDWPSTWGFRNTWPRENEINVIPGATLTLVGLTEDPSVPQAVEPQQITAQQDPALSSYTTTPELVRKAEQDYDADRPMTGWNLAPVEVVPLSALELTEHALVEDAATGPIADLMAVLKAGQPLPPIIIDPENRVLDGHTRYWASKRFGYTAIPALREQHGVEVEGLALQALQTTAARWDTPDLPRRPKSTFDEHFNDPITEQDLATYTQYKGRRVIWLGTPGRMLRVPADELTPREDNIFDWDKVAAVRDHIRNSEEPVYLHAPPAAVTIIDLTLVEETQQAARSHRMDEYSLNEPFTTGDDALDLFLADRESWLEETYGVKGSEVDQTIADPSYPAENFEGSYVELLQEAAQAQAEMQAQLETAESSKSGDLGSPWVQLRDGHHRAFGAIAAGEPFVWVYAMPDRTGDSAQALLAQERRDERTVPAGTILFRGLEEEPTQGPASSGGFVGIWLTDSEDEALDYGEHIAQYRVVRDLTMLDYRNEAVLLPIVQSVTNDDSIEYGDDGYFEAMRYVADGLVSELRHLGYDGYTMPEGMEITNFFVFDGQMLELVSSEFRPFEAAAEDAPSAFYHATDPQTAVSILKQGSLQGFPFASFSQIPLDAVVQGSTATFVFGPELAQSLERVEYDFEWYEAHPEQGDYVAGQNNIDNYFEGPDEDDEDPEAEENAWAEAVFQAFLAKEDEEEWISEKDAVIPLTTLRQILVSDARWFVPIRDAVKAAGLSTQVRVTKLPQGQERFGSLDHALELLGMPWESNLWYHVTDYQHLPSIAENGLIPVSEGADQNYALPVAEDAVYLWNSIDHAAYFADSRARGTGVHRDQNDNYLRYSSETKPVILRVRGMDRQLLGPDHEAFLNAFQEAIYSDEPNVKVAGVVSLRQLQRIFAANQADRFAEWSKRRDPRRIGRPADDLNYHDSVVMLEILYQARPRWWAALTQALARDDGRLMLYGTVPPQNIDVAVGPEDPELSDRLRFDKNPDDFEDDQAYEDAFEEFENQPDIANAWGNWYGYQQSLEQMNQGDWEFGDDSLSERFHFEPILQWMQGQQPQGEPTELEAQVRSETIRDSSGGYIEYRIGTMRDTVLETWNELSIGPQPYGTVTFGETDNTMVFTPGPKPDPKPAPFTEQPDAIVAYIIDAHVPQPRRGEGLGRGLFEQVLEQARAAGAQAIYLRGEWRAIPFWEHMGFVEIGAPAAHGYPFMRREAGQPSHEPSQLALAAAEGGDADRIRQAVDAVELGDEERSQALGFDYLGPDEIEDHDAHESNQVWGLEQGLIAANAEPGRLRLYRAIAADPDKIRFESLGEHWSWDSRGVGGATADSTFKNLLVIEALVPLDAVDFHHTVYAALAWPEMRQVTVNTGHPVQVLGYYPWLGGGWGNFNFRPDSNAFVQLDRIGRTGAASDTYRVVTESGEAFDLGTLEDSWSEETVAGELEQAGHRYGDIYEGERWFERVYADEAERDADARSVADRIASASMFQSKERLVAAVAELAKIQPIANTPLNSALVDLLMQVEFGGEWAPAIDEVVRALKGTKTAAQGFDEPAPCPPHRYEDCDHLVFDDPSCPTCEKRYLNENPPEGDPLYVVFDDFGLVWGASEDPEVGYDGGQFWSDWTRGLLGYSFTVKAYYGLSDSARRGLLAYRGGSVFDARRWVAALGRYFGRVALQHSAQTDGESRDEFYRNVLAKEQWINGILDPTQDSKFRWLHLLRQPGGGGGGAPKSAQADAWYHGSPNSFEAFDRGPVFLTRDPGVAKRHAGGKGTVYQVEPVIQRTFHAQDLIANQDARYWPPEPEDLTGLGRQIRGELEKVYSDDWAVFHDSEGLWPQLLTGHWGAVEQPEVLAILQRLGFDSFLVQEGGEEALAVFDPKNVRMAGGSGLTVAGVNRFDIDNFRDGRCRKVVQQIAREYQARGGPGVVGPGGNQYEITVKLPGGGEITAGVDPMDPYAILVEAPKADGGLAMESAEDPTHAAEIMIRMSALELKATDCTEPARNDPEAARNPHGMASLSHAIRTLTGFDLEADKASKIEHLRKRPENQGPESQAALADLAQQVDEKHAVLIPWLFREMKQGRLTTDMLGMLNSRNELDEMLEWMKDEKPQILKMTLDQVDEAMDTWKKERERREALDQAELVWSNRYWECWEAKSHGALCAIGTEEWCVARPDSDYYKRYKDDNQAGRFFMFQLKDNPEHKYLAWVTDGQVEELKDAEDGEVDRDDNVWEAIAEAGEKLGFSGQGAKGMPIEDFIRERLGRNVFNDIWGERDASDGLEVDIDTGYFEDRASDEGVDGDIDDYIGRWALEKLGPSAASQFLDYLNNYSEWDFSDDARKWDDALSDATYYDRVDGTNLIRSWMQEAGVEVENDGDGEYVTNPQDFSGQDFWGSEVISEARSEIESGKIWNAIEIRQEIIKELGPALQEATEEFFVWADANGIQYALPNPNQIGLPFSDEEQARTLTRNTPWPTPEPEPEGVPAGHVVVPPALGQALTPWVGTGPETTGVTQVYSSYATGKPVAYPILDRAIRELQIPEDRPELESARQQVIQSLTELAQGLYVPGVGLVQATALDAALSRFTAYEGLAWA